MTNKYLLTVRSILRQALQNDYNIEIYNYGENSGYYTLSFYHGNSVYNALAYSNINEQANSAVIDYQYAKSNKKMNALIVRLCNAINGYMNTKSRWEVLEQEFKHYNDLFHVVFEAKYSIKENLYMYGMGE